MKKIIYLSAILLSAGLIALSCSKDDSSENDPVTETPTISKIDPAQGPVGQVVTIEGSNFSATESQNTVTFGAATAVPNTATATQLTVTVPEGATSGAVKVTVGGKTATGGTFTVTETAQEVVFPITQDLPEDLYYPGDVLTINGSGFDVNAVYIVLFSQNIAGEVVEVTENSIKVKVPDGAVSGDVTLTFNDETKSLGTLNIGVLAQFYIFEYTENRLAHVDVNTGQVSFVGNDIPYGNNTRNAIIFNNTYIGFQTQDEFNVTNPNIVSIDLDTGAHTVTEIAGIGDNTDFDDFVVDTEGNLYIFHDSDIHRLAKVDLGSGTLTYIGEQTSPKYGNNTRGAVYHKANDEYIGFAVDNENFEIEPHIVRFNLETGVATSVKIPESFLSEGSSFTDLAISPEDELYIFHDSVNKLAKINIETGELTYLENQASESVYGLNTRGAVIYDNQYIGFQMYDLNFNTAPNIVSFDLETGEVTNVVVSTDNLPESINLTDFAAKL
nr:IPT/TIG domain-containing protein [Allomuricauda sp.]